MRPGRSAIVGALAVALTAGALLLAGTTARAPGDPDAGLARAELGDRTFVCTGGLPATRTLHGSVLGGRVERGRVGMRVERITAPAEQARGAFALQSARVGSSLAVLNCPEPRTRWWFAGLGAGVTHDSVLTIDNPRPGSAVVDIRVFGPRGAVAAPGLRGVTISGNSTRSYDLAKVAPAVGEIAASVVARRGVVSVSATDSYALGGIGRAIREWVPAQPVPARDLTLTGLPLDPRAAALVIANPGEVEAVVEAEVIGPEGPFVAKGLGTFRVPPGAVLTSRFTRVFDGKPLAVRLTSPHPVVATVRSTTTRDISYAAAATPLRGVSVQAVPRADRREMHLVADADDGQVELITYDAAGERLGTRIVKVDGQTTIAVRLGPRVGFVRTAAVAGQVRAGMLLRSGSGGGSGSVGTVVVPPGARALRLPVVRPAW